MKEGYVVLNWFISLPCMTVAFMYGNWIALWGWSCVFGLSFTMLALLKKK